MIERSSYAWNLPTNCEPLAARLAAGGCNRIWVKAGVDNPGLRTVWKQWTDGRCEAFVAVGIEVCPWFYIYPEDPAPQWDTIARALRARPSLTIALNAEVEWDGISEEEVRSWIAGLRLLLRGRDLMVDSIGFSSVPSWDGGKWGGSIYHAFPYEAFVLCTDFDMPQDYWMDPDQADYENKRNVDNSPVIPILTACGEMTDAGILARARKTLAECKNLVGFSAWECANGAYQFDAIAGAYAMLPQDNLVTTTAPATSIVTPASDWGPGSKGRIVHRAETIIVINDDTQQTYLGIKIDGNQLPWQEVK